MVIIVELFSTGKLNNYKDSGQGNYKSLKVCFKTTNDKTVVLL